MSIYMHSSGYDITFENEEQEYRASALIREYSIYDVEQKEFLRLTSKGMFCDERVLYLKYYLNGFSLNGKPGIVWVDDEHFPQSNLLQNARKGVYIIKDGKKTTEKDKRWKSHATLTLLAKQDLPTFGYNMIAPLKSWCWGSILFYPFKISRFS